MKSFHQILRESRTKKGLLLREVARKLRIDQALISKFENGTRKPTKQQVLLLAKFYQSDEAEFLIEWKSEKVVYDLKNEENANEILKAAEKKMQYLKGK